MHWLPRGMARLWCSANTHSTKSWGDTGGGLDYRSQGLKYMGRKVSNYQGEGVKLPGRTVFNYQGRMVHYSPSTPGCQILNKLADKHRVLQPRKQANKLDLLSSDRKSLVLF